MSVEPSHRVHTRPPRGSPSAFRRLQDRDEIAPYLSDAAHYPDGRCLEVAFPESEADVASMVGEGRPLLAVGAQSSLTGGATPTGGVLLSTTRLDEIRFLAPSVVRVGAGVVLASLEERCAERDLYYPPIPTYDGATVGGTAATNAAGAATFKYGTTRDWVQALTVVLATGDVLDLERGQVRAAPEGCFEIVTGRNEIMRVPVPGYRMPQVPKRSAGYHAEPGMDLLDLFIGAEGTLGIIVAVELRLLDARPAWLTALVPLVDDVAAVALTRELREVSLETRRSGDPRGIDLAAIEYLDASCLRLLREDHAEAALGAMIPAGTGAALLLQCELAAGTSEAQAFDELSRLDDATADSRLVRLARLLAEHGVLGETTPALPGQRERRAQLLRLREAVPESVNRRIRERQRTVDHKISKSGGDVIVPFDRFADALERYRDILDKTGVEHAIWGHISDGNLHPNLLPRSAEEMARARQAQLDIGQVAIDLGGCPMSEHGVGRNPVKHELLRRLYGERGVEDMRAVKRALDSRGVFAPGVLFPTASVP
jgi:D-lactate dehydrogenase (cytochrome)